MTGPLNRPVGILQFSDARSGEQVALHQLNAQIAENLEFFNGLNTFAHKHDPKIVCHSDQMRDHYLFDRCLIDMADQLHVELQDIRLEA